MKMVTLGSTGITVPQNGFGALPVQRDDMDTAIRILRRAYEGGITFFDTARSYTDSEEKIGNALSDVRKKIYIATKTQAKTPDEIKRHIETSLSMLKTDYIDIYQFHCAGQVYAPEDGTGMYECMESLKQQGIIHHIGITAHKLGIAIDAANSGLYETIQFPFSYLSSDKEMELVTLCAQKNIGFIAMKALAGGLINNSRAAFAFISQFDNVVPIWGIQRESELDEWLALMHTPAELDEATKALIAADKKELDGDFCRGCGYCMPCPQGIRINQCARISLLLRRAPSEKWLTKQWQDAVKDIEKCTHCGSCMSKCPYELNTPELLRKNYEDYMKVLRGEIRIDDSHLQSGHI